MRGREAAQPLSDEAISVLAIKTRAALSDPIRHCGDAKRQPLSDEAIFVLVIKTHAALNDPIPSLRGREAAQPLSDEAISVLVIKTHAVERLQDLLSGN